MPQTALRKEGFYLPAFSPSPEPIASVSFPLCPNRWCCFYPSLCRRWPAGPSVCPLGRRRDQGSRKNVPHPAQEFLSPRKRDSRWRWCGRNDDGSSDRYLYRRHETTRATYLRPRTGQRTDLRTGPGTDSRNGQRTGLRTSPRTGPRADPQTSPRTGPRGRGDLFFCFGQRRRGKAFGRRPGGSAS